MLNAIWFVIKVALFTCAVLVLGNWIHWDGRTVSDQVRSGLSAVERSDMVSGVKGWVGNIGGDVRASTKNDGAPVRRTAAASGKMTKGAPEEDVASSERQKLRALIRELNSAR